MGVGDSYLRSVFLVSNYYSRLSRYRNGVRGHLKAVVLGLLRQYLQTETLFNEGESENNILSIIFQIHWLQSHSRNPLCDEVGFGGRNQSVSMTVHSHVLLKNSCVLRTMSYSKNVTINY